MLKSYSVKNFRNLNVEHVSFKKINLFVGPNNSGKTNLIDGISFFSGLILNEMTGSAFLDMLSKKGWDDILNKNVKKPAQIYMKWTINTDPSYPDVSYKLQFQIAEASQIPKGFFITDEHLRYSDPIEGQSRPFEFIHCHGKYPGQGHFSARDRETGKHKRVRLEVDMYESVFRQLEALLEYDQFRINLYPNFKQMTNTVEDFFSRFRSYSSTDYRLDLLREPAKIDLTEKYLNKNAANFVNVLSYLDQEYDFLEQYTDILRRLIPDLNKIKILHTSDSKREVRLIINSMQYKLSEMSDGTLKAMILALLLNSPEKTTILSLDEPELNLHPAWLKVITNWVLKTKSIRQIFISTHSPDLLDGFTESFMNDEVGLFVFQLDQQESIKMMKYKDLKSFIDEGWELGDLYRVGDPALGGWPW